MVASFFLKYSVVIVIVLITRKQSAEFKPYAGLTEITSGLCYACILYVCMERQSLGPLHHHYHLLLGPDACVCQLHLSLIHI